MIYRILALGDVVGPEAVWFVKSRLKGIKERLGIDFTVINGENSAKSNGIDRKSADDLFFAGADVITTGNHAFKRSEIREYYNTQPALLRPANYPDSVAGKGWCVVERAGVRVLVMNVLGLMYLEPLACPFAATERMLKEAEGLYDISVMDIHAEATSEKIAFSHAFDGRINVIFGTHTHVQTADNRIMPKGTGYITDLGMCGPENSVLGIKTENIIEKLTMHTPVKFDFSENLIELHGAVFEIDTEKGRAVDVRRYYSR